MSTTLNSVTGIMFQERKFYIDTFDMEKVFEQVLSHSAISLAYDTLFNYYRGKHIILGRAFEDTNKPNNKLIHNFPKLITDNSVSYFMGKPVSYTGKNKEVLEEVQEILDYNNVQTIDAELAKLTSIYGHAFEVFWMDAESNLRFKHISPKEMMMCYSMDIEEKPVCAVNYYERVNSKSREREYHMTVYTESEVIKAVGSASGKLDVIESTPHYFGRVPVVEYMSNEERMGDFEVVLSLIDAYNICNSDSVNDINYLNDAYLMLKNIASAEPEDIEDMKNNRVMLVDGDGDAQWLVKNINDLHIENIKKRLVEDIHKFSMTPNISDEKFASNLSGVAISYKLNSLESKTAVRERMFFIGLRKRMEIICSALSLASITLDASEIYPTFTRNIPQNLLDIVSTVVQLQGLVPTEELLSLLPFMDDPEYAMEKAKKEREENMQSAYGAFKLEEGGSNVPESRGQVSKESEQDL